MEVSTVECEKDFSAYCIGAIELHRADHVAFRANSKQLGLHRIKVVARIDLLSENGIERFKQQAAGCLAVGGCVLVSIGNPDVRYRGGSQFFSKVFANSAAGDTMLHPELPNFFI